MPVGGGPPASRPRCELRSARRLEARPGPATAHGHRSLALRTLRHPPHRRRLRGCVSPRSPARPRPRPWVPQPGPPTPWPCCFVACGTANVPGAVGPGRVAGLLGVPVGGGPPASRPRCELRSARRLEARPGPAAAHGLRSLALRRPGLAVLLLVAPLVFWRRRARPPARSPHTSLRLGVVDLEARPGPPDPPAPSTLASLVSLCVVELPLEARSCPAPREIATHEPSARSGRSRSPPVPSGPSGALHTGGACAVVCRLEARPGPAAAHGCCR